MAVAWLIARAGMRHRPRGLFGFVVIITLGLGVSIAAFEIARRTEDAFPRYLERANVGELVVNPNLSDARGAELITTTPGVTGYTSDDLLTAGIDPGRPVTQAEVDTIGLVVRMSSDGRYTEQDRPVVERGRMLRRGGAEVFLNRHAADELGLDVGDEITLAFYRPSFSVGSNAPDFGPARDDVVEPIGRSTARVVGIGALATDVLPDDLYPQSVMLISPEVGEQFTCTFNPIDPDEDLTIDEHLLATFPADCALSYRYFSLQYAGGDDAIAAVSDELVARAEDANERLPAVVREAGIGYLLAPTPTSDERDRVIDSVRPPAAALRVFALVAGLATLVLALLSALRIARREQANQDVLRQLGVTRRERFLGLLAPLAASAALGLIGAIGVALAGSGFGAVASVRVLEPTRFALAGSVLALAGCAGVVLLAGLTAIAWIVARSRVAPPVPRPSVLLRLTGTLHPSRRFGMQAATRGLSAATVGIGSITAVIAVVASLVFATSVNGLVDTPARYGWPYDVGVIIGFGYGGSDVDAIAESLDRTEVEEWGLAALDAVTIDGETLPAVFERAQFAGLDMPVIDGRRPDGPGEIALGAASAAKIDAEVGDTVSVVTSYGEVAATVTGLVVLPSVGPYQFNRAASGTGALVSEPLFANVLTDAEKSQGLPPGSLADIDLGAFLAIELADGVDVDEFLASIDADDRRSWNRSPFESLFYPRPVRPAAIADVAGMRGLPIALGGLFAVAMAAGLATGIAVATRARRRELAILGALGCTPRQLAASVRWHALTVASIALLVGIPLGVAAGRVLYRNFALDLGVLPTITTSPLALAGVVVGTIMVGLLASALPAHRSSRTRIASSLREE